MPEHHKIGLDHRGELDEIFIENAFVHIERMDETAFWIGIEGDGMPMIHLRTGVCHGVWYFNVEEDTRDNPQYFPVQRPRRSKPIKAKK